MRILLIFLLSSNIYADDFKKYYRSMVYNNAQQIIKVKTNEDDKPLIYSVKSVKNVESIIISEKEFARLMRDLKI